MWKGSISFGLVTIPVKLYAATESKDLRFNLLHEECQTPIQYRKFCPHCEREVESEEIVKGYEFERGRYVTLTEEDFESIPLAAKRTLEIVGFVRLEEIDPVYYDKTYYLEPGEGGAKAYALLRHAMELTGRVAVARVVIRSRESLAALRVFQNGVLAMETMHFPDEVRSVAGLTGITTPELRPQEIEMATGLIESLTTEFAPEKFENEYRDALLEVIQAKIAGAPTDVAAPEPEQGRVVDLMEALRASIRAAEGKRQAPGVEADEPDRPAAAPVPGIPAGAPVPGVPGASPAPGVPAPPPAPGVPATPPVPGVPASPRAAGVGGAAGVPGVPPGSPVPGAPATGTVPGVRWHSAIAPAAGPQPTQVPPGADQPAGDRPPGGP